MTNTTEPNTICGLPQHLQCYSSPHSFRGGAMEPGAEIRVDCTIPDRFLMTLQQFYADGPVNGLLMWDCEGPRPMRVSSSSIPSPREHRWFFFGYLCERCRRTFLLPYWAGEKNDLARAVHHGCHGGLDIDEVPRQRIRELAQEVAVQVLDKLYLRVPTLVEGDKGYYAGAIIVQRLENAMESLWKWMTAAAVEKAQGRRG